MPWLKIREERLSPYQQLSILLDRYKILQTQPKLSYHLEIISKKTVETQIKLIVLYSVMLRLQFLIASMSQV